jgi:hypothetical protein
VVSEAASRGENLKLVYTDPCTGERGVIDCTVSSDGEVLSCRRLKLVFRE